MSRCIPYLGESAARRRRLDVPAAHKLPHERPAPARGLGGGRQGEGEGTAVLRVLTYGQLGHKRTAA